MLATGESGVNDRMLFDNPLPDTEVAARRAKIPPFLLNLILDLWLKAQQMLYPDWKYDAHTENQMVVLLHENLYNHTVNQLDEKTWLGRHDLFLRMMQENL